MRGKLQTVHACSWGAEVAGLGALFYTFAPLATLIVGVAILGAEILSTSQVLAW